MSTRTLNNKRRLRVISISGFSSRRCAFYFDSLSSSTVGLLRLWLIYIGDFWHKNADITPSVDHLNVVAPRIADVIQLCPCKCPFDVTMPELLATVGCVFDHKIWKRKCSFPIRRRWASLVNTCHKRNLCFVNLEAFLKKMMNNRLVFRPFLSCQKNHLEK